MLSQMLAQSEGVLGAVTPEEASARFHEAASAAGASYMQTRLYRRPDWRSIGCFSPPSSRFRSLARVR